MAAKVCLHGLTEDKRNVRLLQSDGRYPPATTKFDVGQIWDMTFSPARRLVAPHSEDVLISTCKPIGQEADMAAFLHEHALLWRGGPDELFGGLLKSIMNKKKLFISDQTSFQPRSIEYWLLDAPMVK
jgi:hypothetical protein